MTSFASNTRLTHRADLMHNSLGSNTTSMPSNWVLSSTGSNGGVVWTPAGGGVGTHNLLSLTHPDTTTASVVRGDMVAASSNASWKRMASPSVDAYTSDRFLGTLNDDPHWRTRYYGVDALTSSSSNAFRGQVDLRAGTGVDFSVASNTVTISVLGAVTGDTAIAYSSGDVTTTSSLQDITGCSVSLTAGTWIVGAVFDTLVNNALNDRTFEGHLDSGGADQTNFAPLVAGTLLNDRWAVPQTWRLVLSSTTTVKLRAKHSGGTTGDFTVKAQSVLAAWRGGSGGSGFADPMTTRGDVIVRDASNVTARLAVGAAETLLASDGTDVSWQFGGWTRVRKTSNESVTNNTFQNDDELFFTATSGVVYEFELVMIYDSAAGGTPDIKVDYGEDGTIRGNSFALYWSTGNAPSSLAFNHYQGNTLAMGTDTAKRIAQFRGNHLGNGGTFQLRWAQNTTNATATVVYAGSYLRYRVVA